MRSYQFAALFTVALCLAFVPAAVRYAIGATAAKLAYKTGEAGVKGGAKIVQAGKEFIEDNIVPPSEFEKKQEPQTITVRIIQGETSVTVQPK